MALALLGIPWLATTIIGVLGGIVSFFATYIGKRIAIIVVVIAACLILVGVFLSVINGIMDGLIPAGISGSGWTLFVPDGLGTILSLWLTAKIAFWLYSWNVKIATLRIL